MTGKRKFFFRNEWRKRVDPVFTRYWAAMKMLWILSANRNSKGKDEAISRAIHEMGAASRELRNDPSSTSVRIWPVIFAGVDGEGTFSGADINRSYITSPESSPVFRELVFFMYGITFRELVVEIEKDPNAHSKLMRVHGAFSRLRAGEGGLNHSRLKFKLTHFQVMVQGLDFGFKDLNEWELASCFDEICPCAQKHSVESMKKFRVRVKKACEHILSSIEKPTSFEISP
jgi:hypothetical protein